MKETTPKSTGTQPETVNIDRQKLEYLEKQVALLTKVASKARLSRHTDKEERGLKVKVTVFRKEDENMLVTNWKLVRDYVRGDNEEQIVEVTLEDKTKEQLSMRDFGFLEKVEVELDLDKSKFTKIRDIQNEEPVEHIDLEEAAFLWKGEIVTLNKTFIN